MDLLKIVALSFGSVIFLFILTKLMGNKEMSQLSMFDYIIYNDYDKKSENEIIELIRKLMNEK